MKPFAIVLLNTFFYGYFAIFAVMAARDLWRHNALEYRKFRRRMETRRRYARLIQ